MKKSIKMNKAQIVILSNMITVQLAELNKKIASSNPSPTGNAIADSDARLELAIMCHQRLELQPVYDSLMAAYIKIVGGK